MQRALLFFALLSPCWGATRTVEIASFNDRQIVIEYDWDDVTSRITTLRIRNQSNDTAGVSVVHFVTGQRFTFTCAANRTRTQNIPASANFVMISEPQPGGNIITPDNLNWEAKAVW